MISNANRRSILRWMHLFFSIPILSYIYGKPSDVQLYAGAVRFVFVPAIFLSGFWMYAGVAYAIISVAAWVGAYELSGLWGGILSQVTLLIGRKAWLRMRARQPKVIAPVPRT